MFLFLRQIFKLLTHRHSAPNVDRHVHVLLKLCKHLQSQQGGISNADLKFLAGIIDVVAQRISEGVIAYAECLTGILTHLLTQLSSALFTPPGKDLYHETNVQAFVSAVVRCVSLDMTPSTATAASYVIACWHASTFSYGAMFANACQLPLIGQTMATALPSLSDNGRTEILFSLAAIAQRSKSKTFLAGNLPGLAKCARFLGQILGNTENFSLWEAGKANDILGAWLSTPLAALILEEITTASFAELIRDAVRCTAIHASSDIACAHRNDVFGTCLQYASLPSTRPLLINVGMLDVLIRFATWTEAGRRHPDIKNIRLTNSEEDFEYHKMLIAATISLLVEPPLKMLATAAKPNDSNRVLGLLFGQIDGDNSARNWTTTQQVELQLMSLACLSSVALVNIDVYMELRGNTHLLNILEKHINPITTSPSVPSQLLEKTLTVHTLTQTGAIANSFYNTIEKRNGILIGDKNPDRFYVWPDRPIARLALRALNNICCLSVSNLLSEASATMTIVRDLGDQGALALLLLLLERPLNHDVDLIEVGMRANALRLVASICDSEPHFSDLFGLHGVSVILKYLVAPSALINAVSEWCDLAAAAVHCTWVAVVGCVSIEADFLAREGVFLLFDLAVTCPSLRRLVLNSLCDLTERKPALRHLLAWRGSVDALGLNTLVDGSSVINTCAGEVLIRLWREAERSLQTETQEDGVLSSTTLPLAGVAQVSRY